MQFKVTAAVTISVWTEVDADSEEQAKEIASDRAMQSLCHQCGGSRRGEGREEWRTSGELDGTPFDLEVAVQNEK